MKSTNDSHDVTGAAQPHANAAQFQAQLRASMDELLLKTRTHQDAWGFGEEEQWMLDEGTGELVFTFPDLVASAPAQVIGTYDARSGLWTWAWADESLPELLREDANRVKEYGETHGFQHLLVPIWQAEESHCWYMTALACSLAGCAGAYRGVFGDVYKFITFREVVTSPVLEPEEQQETPDDFTNGAVEEFRACLEDPEQQRQACCRYFKRGVMAGISQDELIHRLGLAAPSVLDLAGYPADASENIMGMLKSISDEEIIECPA